MLHFLMSDLYMLVVSELPYRFPSSDSVPGSRQRLTGEQASLVPLESSMGAMEKFSDPRGTKKRSLIGMGLILSSIK